ncbi:photosystem I assembly factor PSA3, chloroplastic [Salvia miltiorrhiza]|uniref:photosystem I assembly factor PSA3, chloroplastic n=1 Tax=Salvia miltiorrhiza TaxID=226208 RepID=UPI0025AB670D|nr:photosystem I assembly factor PSA3, chloroplastic [Salvia miltiorrhiza]
MAVVSPLQTNPQSSHIYSTICKPAPPSLLRLRHLYAARRSRRKPNGGVRAYMEDSNTLAGFANKVLGSLPVIGLFARIISDEGGVGGDIIDFAEFRRRVGNKCSVNDSRALFELQDRRGKAGDPLYVLLCCWLAAVGAGLLKSEDILEGVARLRISNDIEFEEENFIAMIKEAREKRARLNAPAPNIPMAVRAEKALEAIYVCCFGRDAIEEEDEELLCTILNAVFPAAGKQEIERIVREKAQRIADGTDEIKIPEPKPLPKEAVQLQMKDLEFLKQGSDTS